MKEEAYSEILDGDVLSRLSGQFLHARQPMVGNIVGAHKSPYRGSSVEFAEYRLTQNTPVCALAASPLPGRGHFRKAAHCHL